MGGNKWLWIISFYLGLMILLVTFFEFKALDQKIEKAIEKQNQINQKMYEIAENQGRSIRLLQTDTEILMNIAINGEYCMEFTK